MGGVVNHTHTSFDIFFSLFPSLFFFVTHTSLTYPILSTVRSAPSAEEFQLQKIEKKIQYAGAFA